MKANEAQAWRDDLLSALPEGTSLHGDAPSARFVYLPPSHLKALRPDATVVVGMRGAGKSFWWAALQQPEVRTLLAGADARNPHADLDQTGVVAGFGEALDSEASPDRDTLVHLLERGVDAWMIWRTVVLHNLRVLPVGPHVEGGRWPERCGWVGEHPEEAALLLHAADQHLQRENRWLLILFDALDRSARDRAQMDDLIRGLLQTALDVRGCRRIRVKCFLRPDQIDNARVGTFPDASKLLATRVELHWAREDLYGLLWQYMANGEATRSERFRQMTEREFGLRWSLVNLGRESVWSPDPDTQGEGVQRRLFHALAGEWMGTDHRRGFPYTWIHGHLADAYGRTSPRSFLVALRAAADDSQTRHASHAYALHYESIKRGVQAASRVRVAELLEDNPWVERVMQPLAGLVVPCRFQDVVSRWRQAGSLQDLDRTPRSAETPVDIPPHLPEGERGVRRDLEDLGIFLSMEDGGINVPDVFRVGYGLGRRGGVKPVHSRSAE